MAGHALIAIAVIDIDQNMTLGRYGAHPLREVHNIRPSDKANIGQTVMTRGETKTADEQSVVVSGGDGCRENVIDTDKGKDIPRGYFLP